MRIDRYDQSNGMSLIHGPEMTPAAQYAWWQSAPKSWWEHMVLTPDTLAVHWRERHPHMNGSGIYMLAGRDGGLDYIGKSKDLYQRINQHCLGAQYGREPQYHSYACIELPEHAYHDVEVAHIYALEPPNNRKYDLTGWPAHAEMVKHIKEIWGSMS